MDDIDLLGVGETETYCVLFMGETETYRVGCGGDRDLICWVWVKRLCDLNKKKRLLDNALTVLMFRVGAG